MRGRIISQDQQVYLVLGDDGKRYQFSNWDWLGKNPPQVGDAVDFVCEGDTIKSVVPLLVQQVSEHSQVVAGVVCWFLGLLGIHRFIVGKIGTGILMLVLSLSMIGLIVSLIWRTVDFIFIVTGKFTDKNGYRITN
ncbi:TM2 domain-containing protein [Bartonella machadoae]|uniref:TM2 domain-containing protein n=1 Tax=Bartonella machadoae TaxID=2893471 RepID=UPI001F4C9AEA|nr:TM2 domain-containing protein [Bartonella machadoae]UNE54705.1 NINE protein [Bartonella machadoae]